MLCYVMIFAMVLPSLTTNQEFKPTSCSKLVSLLLGVKFHILNAHVWCLLVFIFPIPRHLFSLLWMDSMSAFLPTVKLGPEKRENSLQHFEECAQSGFAW